MDNCPKIAAKNKSAKKPPPQPSGPVPSVPSCPSKEKHWLKAAPNPGEAHSKQVCKDGVCTEYKWCGTCKR